MFSYLVLFEARSVDVFVLLHEIPQGLQIRNSYYFFIYFKENV